MAGRKAQHDADFFPFFAKDGRTLFMLQSKFDLEGIGFFTNLLRLLCTTPHHYLDLSDPMQALYTWSKIGLKDEEKAVKMIELMVATGKIDRQLWTEKRVIFSQDFVDSLAELYAKRKEKALSISDIRGIYSISTPEMPIPAPEMQANANNRDINTQSRGEDRRVKKNLRVPGNPDPKTPSLDQPSTPSRLTVPLNLKFSAKDLAELEARFGTRSQEALDKIGMLYAAKNYGYKNHWAGVKLWLADFSSAIAWLDSRGPAKAQAPTAVPADTRGFNTEPVPEDERVDLSAFDPEDFTRRSTAHLEDFGPRAPDEFDRVVDQAEHGNAAAVHKGLAMAV